MSLRMAALKGARGLYFASPLYVWRLDKGLPTELAALNDDWPGDAGRGTEIIEGWLRCPGQVTVSGTDPWAEPVTGQAALDWLHGFAWLRDLRELGGTSARLRARELVSRWLKRHRRWNARLWRADLVGERLASWIGTYRFFCESADDEFIADIARAVARQARHLENDLPSVPAGARRFTALKGLAVAAVALERGEAALRPVMERVTAETGRQINEDGGHVSRSPWVQFGVLRDLIDIRRAAIAAGIDAGGLADIVEQMAAALRLWRHDDGRLALFHGALEGDSALIEAALRRTGPPRRPPRALPVTGFERAAAGRLCLILDAGAPHRDGRQAHAAPLALELSIGAQRLFVNCGAAPGQPAWQDSLRATAAHSALVLDDRNAAELDPARPEARPDRVTVDRFQENGNILLDAEHDGYLPTHGVIHQRQLYISRDGADLRGCDLLTHQGGPDRGPAMAVIRFHLHPRIRASLTRSGRAVLLRLPAGGGWRFRTDGELALADSVYFGEGGRRQRCTQIVVSRPVAELRRRGDEIAMRWALQREPAGRPAAAPG